MSASDLSPEAIRALKLFIVGPYADPPKRAEAQAINAALESLARLREQGDGRERGLRQALRKMIDMVDRMHADEDPADPPSDLVNARALLGQAPSSVAAREEES